MSQPGKSILLVDDDQEIRELLETYLSRVGFQVRAVADGAAFRQSLCAESADLVILDVMLPDEDGFSLCRWVREHQRFAQVPVIMLTASSDEADRVIGLELGADDYLGKPFSPRELLARIKALLRRAQFTQERSGEVLAFDDWRLDMVVDMAVSRLRQRLRDTDKPPRLIRTVRGSGYQLAATVSLQAGDGR